MRMIIATLMLAGSGFYLYRDYQDKILNAPVKTEAPAPVNQADLAPILDAKQLAALHESLLSGDQSVRWAAMQTLYTLGDPQIMPVLEKAMTAEVDPEIRVSIVLLLKTSTDRAALKVLGLGVRDADATVRVASLRVLGEVGDLTATGVVAEAVNDPEDGVKLEAMSALTRLQEAQRARYEKLNDQLRRQYEEQVKKSRENAG